MGDVYPEEDNMISYDALNPSFELVADLKTTHCYRKFRASSKLLRI